MSNFLYPLALIAIFAAMCFIGTINHHDNKKLEEIEALFNRQLRLSVPHYGSTALDMP